jgi:hypothetical protein
MVSSPADPARGRRGRRPGHVVGAVLVVGRVGAVVGEGVLDDPRVPVGTRVLVDAELGLDVERLVDDGPVLLVLLVGAGDVVVVRAVVRGGAWVVTGATGTGWVPPPVVAVPAAVGWTVR